MVSTQGVRVTFGGLVALDDVDFEVRAGEIHGLIGPNGAGKSTLVNVIAGLQPADRGSVHMAGQRLDGLSPIERAQRGLGRTFQHPAMFETLTVRENLELAIRFRKRKGKRLPADPEEWLDEQVVRLEETEWHDVVVSHTPYPVHKTVETLRALLAAPEVLIVDEPAAGLPNDERDRLVTLLTDARDVLGIGIVVIEHDVPLVFGICDRMTVLHSGRVIARGTPAEVRRDPAVREAYLGGGA